MSAMPRATWSEILSLFEANKGQCVCGRLPRGPVWSTVNNCLCLINNIELMVSNAGVLGKHFFCLGQNHRAAHPKKHGFYLCKQLQAAHFFCSSIPPSTSSMPRLAIIPARSGSKRIPGKNVREFDGMPIIGYSIKAARDSELFDEVMVSTDDRDIADLAVQLGARVPFLRSPENADDHATTADVLLEVVDMYRQRGLLFDVACCIYATAPFTTADLLRRCFNKLEAGAFDTVFPVVEYEYPIQRSLQLNDGHATMVWPEYERSRSQDLAPRFHDSGMFYWFRPNTLSSGRGLLNANSGAVVISGLACHDIDCEDDWCIAELKFRRLRALGKRGTMAGEVDVNCSC